VDRHTRKDLKTDKFAQEVTHTFDFLTEHRKEAVRYGSIGLVVLVIAVGAYFYNQRRTSARETALAEAMRIDDGTVGPNAAPTNLHYDTEEAKQKAHDKAFTELAQKYSGSQEGSIAGIFLAADAVDKGDLATAEKRYKEVADSAPKPYAAVAKLALAQVYAGQNKTADAEKVLRDLIANPALTVSKEEATLALAQILAKSKPDEAKKLLEPLRNSRSSISQAAVTALGDLSQASSTGSIAIPPPAPQK
jgi:predicted negative regulator of RcsB-dependent stress response